MKASLFSMYIYKFFMTGHESGTVVKGIERTHESHTTLDPLYTSMLSSPRQDNHSLNIHTHEIQRIKIQRSDTISKSSMISYAQ